MDFQANNFARKTPARTIVLTGAGISKNAGIPTFEEFPELREILSIKFFNQDYKEFWNTVKELNKTIEGKEPTIAHKLIASQKEWLVVTMNIDSLHQKAGTEKILEVHGNLQNILCTKCFHKYSFKSINESLYCQKCGGKLKPTIALYGEDIELYRTVMKEIQLYSNVIIIGTSFTTNFAEQFKIAAEKLGKDIYIFNDNANVQLTEYLIDLECSFF